MPKCAVCDDVGMFYDTTRKATACERRCQHNLPGCLCEGEPTICSCEAGADLFERILWEQTEGNDNDADL